MAAKPLSAMLIYETALRAGAGNALTSVLGRPACAVLPLTNNTGLTSLSLGCAGNRTFAALPADEMYVCIPARHWERFVSKVGEIDKANCDMKEFYQDRKAEFAAV